MNLKALGRKKINIDWDFVNEKLEYFWDGQSIAESLGIHFNTLERKIKEKYNLDFSEFKRQKRERKVQVIIEKQLRVAEKGNIAMLIWIGKQYCDQSDKTDHTTKGERITDINITVASETVKNQLQKILEPSIN